MGVFLMTYWIIGTLKNVEEKVTGLSPLETALCNFHYSLYKRDWLSVMSIFEFLQFFKLNFYFEKFQNLAMLIKHKEIKLKNLLFRLLNIA